MSKRSSAQHPKKNRMYVLVSSGVSNCECSKSSNVQLSFMFVSVMSAESNTSMKLVSQTALKLRIQHREEVRQLVMCCRRALPDPTTGDGGVLPVGRTMTLETSRSPRRASMQNEATVAETCVSM